MLLVMASRRWSMSGTSAAAAPKRSAATCSTPIASAPGCPITIASGASTASGSWPARHAAALAPDYSARWMAAGQLQPGLRSAFHQPLRTRHPLRAPQALIFVETNRRQPCPIGARRMPLISSRLRTGTTAPSCSPSSSIAGSAPTCMAAISSTAPPKSGVNMPPAARLPENGRGWLARRPHPDRRDWHPLRPGSPRRARAGRFLIRHPRHGSQPARHG